MDPADLESLLRGGGMALPAAVLFAQTGMLLGVFLPGNSLLVLVGFLAGATGLPLPLLLATLLAAATAGDALGFQLGRRLGPVLERRGGVLWIRERHLRRTHAFYERRGAWSAALGRWVPVARTFFPLVAGIAGMRYRRFLPFNLLGNAVWVTVLTLLGYFLGGIPAVRDSVDLVLGGIVAVGLGMLVWKLRQRGPGDRPRPRHPFEASRSLSARGGAPARTSC